MLLSFPLSLRPPKPATLRRTPAFSRRRVPFSISLSLEALNGTPSLSSKDSNHLVLLEQSSAPPLARDLGFGRGPELGLCSLLFVISMAVGSFFSLIVISLPALSACRNLSVSMDKLSKVVSDEVPGTLCSLKLSGMEINDLTNQLSSLRHRILGKQSGEKARTKTATKKKPSS